MSTFAFNRFSHPGWKLLGRYLSDVGSWLLHHDGEAMLLELPEGLTVGEVRRGLRELGDPVLKYVTASHEHPDHLDPKLWQRLRGTPPFVDDAEFIRPRSLELWTDRLLDLGGEPLYLVRGPKHSKHDLVAVFRGCAMSGDVELGQLESVNDEVMESFRAESMDWYRGFQSRHDYRVHTVFSAHLDSLYTDADWERLFTCKELEHA